MTSPIAKPWLFSQTNQDPLAATGPAEVGIHCHGPHRFPRFTGPGAACRRRALRRQLPRKQHTADAFAAEFGFTMAYGDDGGQQGYERLLADDSVDVVYVATPHAQHHQVVLAALNAGKHVLCEKAFTINAREAADLVAVAREKNLFLMEAVWSRFLPSMQRAFEIAGSGELGTVQWVTADLGFPAPYSPTARLWAVKDGGGALLDLTVYPLLWALGTLGFPQAVSAMGTLE